MASTVLFLALISFLGLLAAQQTAIITELPAYSSLAECAKSAVSDEALMFSNFWCMSTTVATALAACICLSQYGQFSAQASYGIIGRLQQTCGASASVELSSALNVLTTYCLPASNVAAPTTTTQISSISSPGSFGSVSTTPASTGAPTASNSAENSASPSSTSNDNPSSTNLSSSTSSTTTFTPPTTTSISLTTSTSPTTSTPPTTSTSISSSAPTNSQNLSPPISTGDILGIVVGIPVGLIIVAFIVLAICRRHRRKPPTISVAPSPAIELRKIDHPQPYSHDPQSTISDPISDSDVYDVRTGGGSTPSELMRSPRPPPI